MQYWLLKANPARYRYDDDLRPGFEEDWHSKRPPAALSAGDRLFLWESGPHRRVVGFGEVVRPVYRRDEDGDRVFRVRYLTHRLTWMPGIELLKANRELRSATFLKAGIIQTVYPLDDDQAKDLYRVIIDGNPVSDIWQVGGSAVQGDRGKNWLGHRKGSGAARLDELLTRGATMAELEEVRGGVYEHLKHLRDKFGIQYVRDGDRYRILETSASAFDDLPEKPPTGSEHPESKVHTATRYLRDHKVRAYVLKRAKGRCEYCGVLGFGLADGGFYLETHHILSLAKKGHDTPRNVIAVCATHHREAHFGKDRTSLESEMLEIVLTKETAPNANCRPRPGAMGRAYSR